MPSLESLSEEQKLHFDLGNSLQIGCLECEGDGSVNIDYWGNVVTDCCGVGFVMLHEGKEISVSEDVRYCDDWHW